MIVINKLNFFHNFIVENTNVQVWFLEHTTVRVPANPNKLSRLLKWHDSHSKPWNIRVDNMQPYELARWFMMS